MTTDQATDLVCANSKHGDLRPAISTANAKNGAFCATSGPLANPVLYSFFVDGVNLSRPGDDRTKTSVGRRLGLGVGTDGVVGRAVSVLDQQRKVVGEGVIGWG